MNGFVLTITIVLTGTAPAPVEATFTTQSDCEAARIAVLKEAALVAAMLRKQQITVGIPQVAAVCRQISN